MKRHSHHSGSRPVFCDASGREYAQVEYFRVPLPWVSRTMRLRFYGDSGPEFSAITA